MTIFEVLDKLQAGKFYSVPVNVKSTAYVPVDHKKAGIILTDHRNYYARKCMKTNFQMLEPEEIPVWDAEEKEMVLKQVIKITMTHEKIAVA